MFEKCLLLRVISLSVHDNSVNWGSSSSIMDREGVSGVECTNNLSLEAAVPLAILSTKSTTQVLN